MHAPADNARAMVLGSLAGDSLALGAHWIYDQRELARTFGRLETLAAPGPGSFHPARTAGEFTHYGDQTLVLLKSLARQRNFDVSAFSADWRAMFQGGYTGYVDRATQATLNQLQNGWEPLDAGSVSDDLAGAARISPLVFMLRREPESAVAACRLQTTTTHNRAVVIDAAEVFARTALAALEGTPPVQGMEQALAGRFPGSPLHGWFAAGMDAAGRDSVEAIAVFGQSCHADGAFQSTVQLIARHQDAPSEALVDSVMAGGDSAARNLLVGMVLCAWKGLDDRLQTWVNGLRERDLVETLLEEIA
uniref:ADP-ribosylglycohydrolase family protein n=1 Tax=Fundidesulfovibrio putealis TaxID=270496 RepID=A0A7C4EL36_9BACT